MLNGRSHRGIGQQACVQTSRSLLLLRTPEFQTYPDRVPSHRSNISYGNLSKYSDAVWRPTSPPILNNSHWISSNVDGAGSYEANSRCRDVRLQEKILLSLSLIIRQLFNICEITKNNIIRFSLIRYLCTIWLKYSDFIVSYCDKNFYLSMLGN